MPIASSPMDQKDSDVTNSAAVVPPQIIKTAKVIPAHQFPRLLPPATQQSIVQGYMDLSKTLQKEHQPNQPLVMWATLHEAPIKQYALILILPQNYVTQGSKVELKNPVPQLLYFDARHNQALRHVPEWLQPLLRFLTQRTPVTVLDGRLKVVQPLYSEIMFKNLSRALPTYSSSSNWDFMQHIAAHLLSYGTIDLSVIVPSRPLIFRSEPNQKTVLLPKVPLPDYEPMHIEALLDCHGIAQKMKSCMENREEKEATDVYFYPHQTLQIAENDNFFLHDLVTYVGTHLQTRLHDRTVLFLTASSNSKSIAIVLETNEINHRLFAQLQQQYQPHHRTAAWKPYEDVQFMVLVSQLYAQVRCQVYGISANAPECKAIAAALRSSYRASLEGVFYRLNLEYPGVELTEHLLHAAVHNKQRMAELSVTDLMQQHKKSMIAVLLNQFANLKVDNERLYALLNEQVNRLFKLGIHAAHSQKAVLRAMQGDYAVVKACIEEDNALRLALYAPTLVYDLERFIRTQPLPTLCYLRNEPKQVLQKMQGNVITLSIQLHTDREQLNRQLKTLKRCTFNYVAHRAWDGAVGLYRFSSASVYTLIAQCTGELIVVPYLQIKGIDLNQIFTLPLFQNKAPSVAPAENNSLSWQQLVHKNARPVLYYSIGIGLATGTIYTSGLYHGFIRAAVPLFCADHMHQWLSESNVDFPMATLRHSVPRLVLYVSALLAFEMIHTLVSQEYRGLSVAVAASLAMMGSERVVLAWNTRLHPLLRNTNAEDAKSLLILHSVLMLTHLMIVYLGRYLGGITHDFVVSLKQRQQLVDAMHGVFKEMEKQGELNQLNEILKSSEPREFRRIEIETASFASNPHTWFNRASSLRLTLQDAESKITEVACELRLPQEQDRSLWDLLACEAMGTSQWRLGSP